MSPRGSVHAEALLAIADGLRKAADGFARLAADEAHGGEVPELYTSANRPAGMSRRRFATRCRELVRLGVDGVVRAGRVWSAPRAAFEEPAPIAAKRPGVKPRPANDSGSAWSAEQALRDAGARGRKT